MPDNMWGCSDLWPSKFGPNLKKNLPWCIELLTYHQIPAHSDPHWSEPVDGGFELSFVICTSAIILTFDLWTLISHHFILESESEENLSKFFKKSSSNESPRKTDKHPKAWDWCEVTAAFTFTSGYLGGHICAITGTEVSQKNVEHVSDHVNSLRNYGAWAHIALWALCGINQQTWIWVRDHKIKWIRQPLCSLPPDLLGDITRLKAVCVCVVFLWIWNSQWWRGHEYKV